MKKKLLIVFTVILMLSLASFFGACKEIVVSPEMEKYLVITLPNGETHKLEKDDFVELEVDLEMHKDFPGFGNYFKIDYQAYYKEHDRKCTEIPKTSFNDTKINLEKLGKQTSILEYENGDKFAVVVTVIESRPMPTIEFIPGEDCISFEDGVEYVYSYDGEYHYPQVKIFDGEELVTIVPEWDARALYFNKKIFDGGNFITPTETNIAWCKDVGYYEITLYIPRTYLPLKYEQTFREISKTIFIKIVE